MWKKHERVSGLKKIFVVLILFALLVALGACGGDTVPVDSGQVQNVPEPVSEIESEPEPPTIIEPTVDDDWVALESFEFRFVDDTTRLESNVFELSGGEVRLSYEVVATSVGGNALIYLLPEGATLATDAAGNLSIAVQDVTAIGNRDGTQVVERDAGMYYLLVNTSSVESVLITVEVRP